MTTTVGDSMSGEENRGMSGVVNKRKAATTMGRAVLARIGFLRSRLKARLRRVERMTQEAAKQLDAEERYLTVGASAEIDGLPKAVAMVHQVKARIRELEDLLK